jgi:hypothetical protein
MKRILLSIVGIGLFLTSFSQAPFKPTYKDNVSDPHNVTAPETGFFWGTAADSCIQSTTLSYILRMDSPGMFFCEFTPYITKNSGTVTNKIYFYKSAVGGMGSYNWEKVDSIVVTNASTGYQDTKTISSWIAPWMKVEVNAGATAQDALYKMYATFKW